MKRALAALAAFLAVVPLRASDAPPPKDAPAEPPAKHRLTGGFKGHDVAPAGGKGSAAPAQPAAPPPAASPKEKKPALVIDNAMVEKGERTEGRKKEAREAPKPPPPAAAAPAPAAPVEMPKIVDLQGHDEAYWRAKAAAVRDAVAKASDALAAAEAEEKREENDFYAWDDGQYRDSVIKPAWDRAKAEAEKARADLDAARKQLDGLEDEARRAGAFPGWIRQELP